LGAQGVIRVLHPNLNGKEREQLSESAKSLCAIIEKYQDKLME
jgi:hypothetical protein